MPCIIVSVYCISVYIVYCTLYCTSRFLCLYNCSQYLNCLKAQIQRNYYKSKRPKIIGHWPKFGPRPTGWTPLLYSIRCKQMELVNRSLFFRLRSGCLFRISSLCFLNAVALEYVEGGRKCWLGDGAERAEVRAEASACREAMSARGWAGTSRGA